MKTNILQIWLAQGECNEGFTMHMLQNYNFADKEVHSLLFNKDLTLVDFNLELHWQIHLVLNISCIPLLFPFLKSTAFVAEILYNWAKKICLYFIIVHIQQIDKFPLQNLPVILDITYQMAFFISKCQTGRGEA